MLPEAGKYLSQPAFPTDILNGWRSFKNTTSPSTPSGTTGGFPVRWISASRAPWGNVIRKMVDLPS
jgi:hypothetical protein